MIQIEQLSKRFGRLRAVDELNFSVEPGEVLGILGPNGAGKTTTMRMITGFVSPSGGRAVVCGHDIEKAPQAARRIMGYLPEGAPAYADMTTAQFLSFVADIRGLCGTTKCRRYEEMIDVLELAPVLHTPIDRLSKGYKRRVGLAQALIHDPAVLILDEPTDGLDPNQKRHVRELIARIAADKIILISTHILEEVSAVCTRAIIMAGGRLVADGTPLQLASQSRYSGALTVSIAGAEGVAGSLQALTAVAEVEGDPRYPGRYTLLPAPGHELLPSVAALVQERGWRLEELQVQPGRLDEVFQRLTRPAAEALH